MWARGTLRGAVGAALALAVFVAAAPARGRDPDGAAGDELEAARRLFYEGADAQEAGRYEEALERYTRVRAVVVSPTLLFNIATCDERLGRLRLAAEAYEAALSAAREKSDAEVEREAAHQLELVRRDMPRLVVRLGRDTESPRASLDDEDVDPRSLVDVPIDPGRHHLIVRSEKHDRVFELVFDITRGAHREVDVDLGAVKRPPEPIVAWRTIERPAPVRRTYVPAILSGGSALVLAGGALVTGILGSDRRERYDQLNAAPTAQNRAEREDLRSEGTALYAANGVLLGGAAIAAALAGYFFFRPPAVAAPRKTSVSAGPSGPSLYGAFE